MTAKASNQNSDENDIRFSGRIILARVTVCICVLALTVHSLIPWISSRFGYSADLKGIETNLQARKDAGISSYKNDIAFVVVRSDHENPQITVIDASTIWSFHTADKMLECFSQPNKLVPLSPEGSLERKNYLPGSNQLYFRRKAEGNCSIEYIPALTDYNYMNTIYPSSYCWEAKYGYPSDEDWRDKIDDEHLQAPAPRSSLGESFRAYYLTLYLRSAAEAGCKTNLSPSQSLAVINTNNDVCGRRAPYKILSDKYADAINKDVLDQYLTNHYLWFEVFLVIVCAFLISDTLIYVLLKRKHPI